MYSIKELEKTFHEHHLESVKRNKEQIKEFKRDYPDEPLPVHFKEEFSFPFALSCICRAILNLEKNDAI